MMCVDEAQVAMDQGHNLHLVLPQLDAEQQRLASRHFESGQFAL
jgi:hypothetical protein